MVGIAVTLLGQLRLDLRQPNAAPSRRSRCAPRCPGCRCGRSPRRRRGWRAGRSGPSAVTSSRRPSPASLETRAWIWSRTRRNVLDTLVLAPGRLRRILETPVEPRRATREQRAPFVGVVADGDHVLPRDRPWSPSTVFERWALMSTPDFLHRPDRERDGRESPRSRRSPPRSDRRPGGGGSPPPSGSAPSCGCTGTARGDASSDVWSVGSGGSSHRTTATASAPPMACATMNPGTSTGRIPANESLTARASVTAGFANDVDAVNQYAARDVGTRPPTGRHRPAPRARADDEEKPERGDDLAEELRRSGSRMSRQGEHGAPNMRLATAVPSRPPVTCATMYAGTSAQDRSPPNPPASVTTGLKCAPESGPNATMSASSAAPVAAVFASKARPTLPPANRSPMIPEPTTAATSSPVPTASATARRASDSRAAGGGRWATTERHRSRTGDTVPDTVTSPGSSLRCRMTMVRSPPSRA